MMFTETERKREKEIKYRQTEKESDNLHGANCRTGTILDDRESNCSYLAANGTLCQLASARFRRNSKDINNSYLATIRIVE